jgi:hypothetical protein
MKKEYFVLCVFVLALGALATQSCESTDGQNTYYNRGHYGDYRDGRYAEDGAYYHDGRYAEDSAYYHERGYAPEDYQSDGSAINVHLRQDYGQ